MPTQYSQKSYKKSRYQKKKNYTKRPMTAYQVATIARRVAYKSQPVKECRFLFDKGLKTNVLADSFQYSDITNIPVGTLQDERIGGAVYISGVKVNISFGVAVASTQPKAIRLMLVRTINRDADLLDLTTWTDLFTSTTYADRTADALIGDITAPINTDIVRPLYDQVIRFNPTNTDSSSFVFSKYMKINQKVLYDNDGATSQPINGKIYLIAHLCEFGLTSSANAVQMNGILRVFYRDANV